MNIVELQYGKHWHYRTNKEGEKFKPRIKGKIRKWLNEFCPKRYRILHGNPPPVIIFNDETDAMAFKIMWFGR